jgi:hypothetical protein
MGNEEVVGERDLEDVEIDNQSCSLDHEELLCSLDAVEGNGSLVAVANAGVPVIIRQVLNDELLPYIDDLQHILRREVDQFDRKFTGAHS